RNEVMGKWIGPVYCRAVSGVHRSAAFFRCFVLIAFYCKNCNVIFGASENIRNLPDSQSSWVKIFQGSRISYNYYLLLGVESEGPAEGIDTSKIMLGLLHHVNSNKILKK
ncbi:hypothetical protein J6590_034935, partial [Homalodisca vitripennis]